MQATSFNSRRRELTVEVPTETEVDTFYKRLDRSKIKLVALSLIKPYSDQFISERSSILTIPDLFDSDNLKILMNQWLEQSARQILHSHHNHWSSQSAIHIYLKWTQKQCIMNANMKLVQFKSYCNISRVWPTSMMASKTVERSNR